MCFNGLTCVWRIVKCSGTCHPWTKTLDGIICNLMYNGYLWFVASKWNDKNQNVEAMANEFFKEILQNALMAFLLRTFDFCITNINLIASGCSFDRCFFLCVCVVCVFFFSFISFDRSRSNSHEVLLSLTGYYCFCFSP